jgi:hypothetical protein
LIAFKNPIVSLQPKLFAAGHTMGCKSSWYVLSIAALENDPVGGLKAFMRF